MRFLLLFSALMLLLSCSSTADMSETGSVLEEIGADDSPVDDDRSFSYLKDEWADHLGACAKGWSFAAQALSRGAARDWDRIEKTLR